MLICEIMLSECVRGKENAGENLPLSCVARCIYNGLGHLTRNFPCRFASIVMNAGYNAYVENAEVCELNIILKEVTLDSSIIYVFPRTIIVSGINFFADDNLVDIFHMFVQVNLGIYLIRANITP